MTTQDMLGPETGLSLEDCLSEAPHSVAAVFSLRDHLISQCPAMTESDVRLHASFVCKTLLVNPRLDLSRYRIDPENPGRIMSE